MSLIFSNGPLIPQSMVHIRWTSAIPIPSILIVLSINGPASRISPERTQQKVSILPSPIWIVWIEVLTNRTKQSLTAVSLFQLLVTQTSNKKNLRFGRCWLRHCWKRKVSSMGQKPSVDSPIPSLKVLRRGFPPGPLETLYVYCRTRKESGHDPRSQCIFWLSQGDVLGWIYLCKKRTSSTGENGWRTQGSGLRPIPPHGSWRCLDTGPRPGLAWLVFVFGLFRLHLGTLQGPLFFLLIRWGYQEVAFLASLSSKRRCWLWNEAPR